MAGFAPSFPGQAYVLDDGSGQSELGVGGGDEPGPAVGLCGCAQSWGGPAQGVLDEPEGVLDVETAQVAGPAGVRDCVFNGASLVKLRIGY